MTEHELTTCFDQLLAWRAKGMSTKVRAQDVHSPRGNYTVFTGDLEVTGNLSYEHAVIVVGNLTVDGLIEDRIESSPLLVAGNVRAKGMYVGSALRIGGATQLSEVLHLRTGGDAVFAGGVRTPLVVWPRQAARVRGGALEASHVVDAYPERDDADLVKLRGALAPELARKLDVDVPDLSILARAVREAHSLWRRSSKSAPPAVTRM